MRKTVWPGFLAVAAGLALHACGGKSAPEPALSEPAAPGPGEGEAQGEAAGAPPAQPDPAGSAAQPPPDPAQAKAELMAAEASAFELAEPVLKQRCAKCHVKGGKKAKGKALDHFDMTTYPFGGHHADEISAEIRKVLGIGGGQPTMPKDSPGSVQGDELALIAAWADAYDKAEAGGAHEDREHEAAHDHGSGHEH
jgi:hypothetical protein